MHQPLDIHVATVDERRAAHANVFDVWPRGKTVEEHVDTRDASPLHQRGRWFVGCLDGRVVTSLACHALSFSLRGESVPGIAVGSVHTLAALRGSGFAPRLLDFAEQYERDRGARLSVLFSDINPDYYARLGYRRCPAHRGWADSDASQAAADGSLDGWRLAPLVAAEALEEICRIYAADYARQPLWIEHAGEYARHLTDRRKGDDYYWLISTAGTTRAAYVRLSPAGETLKIADVAVTPGPEEEAHRQRIYRLVIALAGRRGMKRVGGWFPDTQIARAIFRLEDRPDEITMLKPLDAALVLDEACLAAADHFVEIDHV